MISYPCPLFYSVTLTRVDTSIAVGQPTIALYIWCMAEWIVQWFHFSPLTLVRVWVGCQTLDHNDGLVIWVEDKKDKSP